MLPPITSGYRLATDQQTPTSKHLQLDSLIVCKSEFELLILNFQVISSTVASNLSFKFEFLSSSFKFGFVIFI